MMMNVTDSKFYCRFVVAMRLESFVHRHLICTLQISYQVFRVFLGGVDILANEF